jgi:hypothetical protein
MSPRRRRSALMVLMMERRRKGDGERAEFDGQIPLSLRDLYCSIVGRRPKDLVARQRKDQGLRSLKKRRVEEARKMHKRGDSLEARVKDANAHVLKGDVTRCL